MTDSNEFNIDFYPPYVGSAFSPQVDIEETTDDITVTITDSRGEHEYTVPRTEQSIADAEAATAAANSAADNANAKAELADTAATNADTKAALADSKAVLADTAAQNADSKASLANTAADTANASAANADAKATAAQNAANAANSAASMANTAASNADAKATLANTAASNADSKATLANTAAENANTKAGLANEAATAANAAAAAAEAATSEIQPTISEVEDIRTGYNDTVYDSAGDAVRGQIENAEAEISRVYESTREEVGIKLGTYANQNLLFFQGSLNPSTGIFTPGRTDRTATYYLYIPIDARVSVTTDTGYIRSNFIWYDSNKTYISQGGSIPPANARYVRFNITNADTTINITPDEASLHTTFTITQPYSVSGVVDSVDALTSDVSNVLSWYDVYDNHIVTRNVLTSSMANAKFGAAYNGGSYSNGTLTIPSGETGASSYVGLRITSGFDIIKNTVSRVKVFYDDLSGLDIETKILKFPNTVGVNVINSEISLDDNSVEFTFLIDTEDITYLSFGFGIKSTAAAQTSQKTITYQSAEIYSSEVNKPKQTLKVQLFGDSITDDIRVVNNVETTITTWATFIREYMPDYDLTIVNSAVGGSGIGHGKSSTARYSQKTYNYVHDLVTDGTLETNSDVIIMLIGTNNWRGEGGGSFGTLGQLGDDVVTSFYGATNLICKYIAEHTSALFVIATPPQRYNSSDQESDTNEYGEVLNSQNHTLKDFCDALKEVASLYGVPIIDLNDILGWNKYNVSNFTSDGLHPNATGARKIAKLITSHAKMHA